MAKRVITIEYKPYAWAEKWHNNIKRYNVLVLHRRGGKTTATINQLIRDALTNTNHRYAFIEPTYKMAKNIVWDMLKHYCRVIPDVKFNEAELRADFPTGSRITLYGSDNPDALRGITLNGVVFDEYSQQPSNIWSEIIAPTLSTTKGYAIWIGTPKGRNAFYRQYEQARTDEDFYVEYLPVSLSKIVGEEELRQQLKNMTEDEYLQEWECSWEASIQGAYYSKELSIARSEGRIGTFPYDPALPVYTWWDLGVSDPTTILFFQTNGHQWRLIDCYSDNKENLEFYIKYVRNLPYNYDKHFAPHDIEVKDFSATNNKSRWEIAQQLGITFEIVPKLGIDDGISATRMKFAMLYINQDKCQPFIDAIAQYRREWNDKMGTYKSQPLHDWTSHFADAFRYWGVSDARGGVDAGLMMRVQENRQRNNRFR